MFPGVQHLTNHPFDLSGMKVGDRFVGCIKCGYQTAPFVGACVLECPKCQARMTDYRVTEEDLMLC